MGGVLLLRLPNTKKKARGAIQECNNDSSQESIMMPSSNYKSNAKACAQLTASVASSPRSLQYYSRPQQELNKSVKTAENTMLEH